MSGARLDDTHTLMRRILAERYRPICRKSSTIALTSTTRCRATRTMTAWSRPGLPGPLEPRRPESICASHVIAKDDNLALSDQLVDHSLPGRKHVMQGRPNLAGGEPAGELFAAEGTAPSPAHRFCVQLRDSARPPVILGPPTGSDDISDRSTEDSALPAMLACDGPRGRRQTNSVRHARTRSTVRHMVWLELALFPREGMRITNQGQANSPWRLAFVHYGILAVATNAAPFQVFLIDVSSVRPLPTHRARFSVVSITQNGMLHPVRDAEGVQNNAGRVAHSRD